MATRCGGLQLVRSSLPGARSVAQYRSTLTGSSAPNALLNVRLPRAAHRRVEARVFDKLKKMWGDGPPPGGDGSGPQGTGSQEEDGEEDGEMIPLSSEESVGMAGDGGVFGPLAVLLVGFMVEEVDRFRAFMLEIEADMVKIVPCTSPMLGGTLQQALDTESPSYEAPPLGTRRAVILSGMYSSEVVGVVQAYDESGLPPAVFAATVPNNYLRNLRSLLEELAMEQAAMEARSREWQAQRDASAIEEWGGPDVKQ